MTGTVSPQAGEERAAHRFIFQRKGVMKINEATLPIHTVDVSEKGMGILTDQSLPIGFPCMLFFQTVVGGRIVPLNFTGTVSYCNLAGLKGFRIGIRVDEKVGTNKEQLGLIISSRH